MKFLLDGLEGSGFCGTARGKNKTSAVRIETLKQRLLVHSAGYLCPRASYGCVVNRSRLESQDQLQIRLVFGHAKKLEVGAAKPLLNNLVSFREDDQHFAQIGQIARALRVHPDRQGVIARIAFRTGLRILENLTEQWPLLLPPPPALNPDQFEPWEEFVAQVQQTQRTK